MSVHVFILGSYFVFYLFVTPQAKSLDKLQPNERLNQGKSCVTSINQVKNQEEPPAKSSVPTEKRGSSQSHQNGSHYAHVREESPWQVIPRLDGSRWSSRCKQQTQDTSQPHSPSGDSSNVPFNNTYPVDKLLKQRVNNGEHQFLIKWLGFPASQDSWKPAQNITDKRLITTFYKKHPHTTRYEDPNYTPRVTTLLQDYALPDDVIITALSCDESSDDMKPFPPPGKPPGPKNSMETFRDNSHESLPAEPPMTVPDKFQGTYPIPTQEFCTFPTKASRVRDRQVLSNRSLPWNLLETCVPTHSAPSTITPVPTNASMAHKNTSWTKPCKSLSFLWPTLVILITLAISATTHEYN